LRQQPLDRRPFLVSQVARVTLGLLLDPGHPATRRLGPHPKLESRRAKSLNLFQTASKRLPTRTLDIDFRYRGGTKPPPVARRPAPHWRPAPRSRDQDNAHLVSK
jgi:hypothetical protein